MANEYKLIDEFIESGTSESGVVSVDPYWVVAVFRSMYPSTYDRSKEASFSTDFPESVKLRGRPLIITDDCVSLSVSSTKSNHIGTLNASLLPTKNYLFEVMPGDWIMAWMMYGSDTQQEVVQNVLDNKPANKWEHGLKFVGKVTGIRKELSQDPVSGVRVVRYSLNAGSFREFDAQTYYNPRLAQKEELLGRQLANLGVDLNEFQLKNSAGIPGGVAMRVTIDLLMGKGLNKNLSAGPVDARIQSTAGADSPYAFIIPSEVSSVLGRGTSGSKPNGAVGFADVLDFVYGIQQYGDYKVSNEEGIKKEDIFNPVGTRSGNNRRWTGTDMLGEFLPTALQFTGHSAWSILNQYLNPVINEMYATLRVNGDGLVVPTLVARQLPFSTKRALSVQVVEKYGIDVDSKGKPIFSGKTRTEQENITNAILIGEVDDSKSTNTRKVYTVRGRQHTVTVTPFADLPRWKIHPALVYRMGLGRSDAQRFNYVQLYGDPGSGSQQDQTRQATRFPAVRDELDIARNGLRMYDATVPCIGDKEIKNDGPAKWMAVASDILMGQHMTMSGSVETIGIQAPIAIGDNVELDDSILHIESVSHNVSINPGGIKTFRTNLALSYGVAIEPNGNPLVGHYTATSVDGATGYDPGITFDGVDPNL